MKSLKSLTIVTTLLLSQTAAATLIEFNDANYGSGNNVTWDTQTGLEWLDLSVTQSCNIYQINAKSCNGLDFSDWSLASRDQIIEFWGDAGITSLGSYDNVDTAATTALLDNIGYTFSNSSQSGANAIYAETSLSHPVLAQLMVNSSGQSQERLFLYPSSLILTSTTQNRSAFFVRESQKSYDVPAPTTAALLLLGLAGWSATAFRKKRKQNQI